MKNNLLEYINLYKKVFKDEFEEFIKLNPNLEAILNELSNKIERDKDNPNKLVLWSKFAVSLMGAICTFSLLYFLNKDVKQAVRHPIQKARLSKIEAMYDETLNQIESFKDQQKSKTNKERS